MFKKFKKYHKQQFSKYNSSRKNSVSFDYAHNESYGKYFP